MKIIFTDVIEAQFCASFPHAIANIDARHRKLLRRCYKNGYSLSEKYFQFRVRQREHQDGYRRSTPGRIGPLWRSGVARRRLYSGNLSFTASARLTNWPPRGQPATITAPPVRWVDIRGCKQLAQAGERRASWLTRMAPPCRRHGATNSLGDTLTRQLGHTAEAAVENANRAC